jgi:hypothetical protein
VREALTDFDSRELRTFGLAQRTVSASGCAKSISPYPQLLYVEHLPPMQLHRPNQDSISAKASESYAEFNCSRSWKVNSLLECSEQGFVSPSEY